MRHLLFILFLISIFCIGFLYGAAVCKWNIFPYKLIKPVWNAVKEFHNKPKYPHWVSPMRYNRQGLTIFDPNQTYQGVTLITVPFAEKDEWTLGIRLIDSNGTILHTWRCNPKNIWKQSPHHDYIRNTKNDTIKTIIHGTLLLPNGDVLFNFEYFSLVRLNAKSEVVWKLPYRTHHSIFKDENGHFWACGTKCYEKKFLNIAD
jgi:hypothetical protein